MSTAPKRGDDGGGPVASWQWRRLLEAELVWLAAWRVHFLLLLIFSAFAAHYHNPLQEAKHQMGLSIATVMVLLLQIPQQFPKALLNHCIRSPQSMIVRPFTPTPATILLLELSGRLRLWRGDDREHCQCWGKLKGQKSSNMAKRWCFWRDGPCVFPQDSLCPQTPKRQSAKMHDK